MKIFFLFISFLYPLKISPLGLRESIRQKVSESNEQPSLQSLCTNCNDKCCITLVPSACTVKHGLVMYGK